MDDPIKEVADVMDNNKEEGWEKSLANKQVTFVVYREGDQLNFFRVVDRGDGTLTPLSESIRLEKCLCCYFYFFTVLTKRGQFDGQLCHSTSKSPSVFRCSGSSLYNVCTEEDDGENCAASQQSLENSITMNKMKLLKAKMEDMNLNKKVGIRI